MTLKDILFSFDYLLEGAKLTDITVNYVSFGTIVFTGISSRIFDSRSLSS
jgi:hypothetical protein